VAYLAHVGGFIAGVIGGFAFKSLGLADRARRAMPVR
jgi:membrane associated rhomboid family serine protease